MYINARPPLTQAAATPAVRLSARPNCRRSCRYGPAHSTSPWLASESRSRERYLRDEPTGL